MFSCCDLKDLENQLADTVGAFHSCTPRIPADLPRLPDPLAAPAGRAGNGGLT
jgi:hypothetical protein